MEPPNFQTCNLQKEQKSVKSKCMQDKNKESL